VNEEALAHWGLSRQKKVFLYRAHENDLLYILLIAIKFRVVSITCTSPSPYYLVMHDEILGMMTCPGSSPGR
jgi:hypothetical protein